jgi:NADPH:quinone reductase
VRAAIYRRKGPAADVLEVVDLPDPHPGPGEVRVRVAVSGVNPTDWKARSGHAWGDTLPWPYQIPNQDGAGVVDEVGAGVDGDRVGARVWLYHAAWQRPGGTAAQYVCLPAAQAVPLPDGVGFAQAAGLAIPFMTAHRCLFTDGPVAGRSVLVTGGAGAVGNATIQLARWGGAARVVSTVRSPEKARLAAAAGADEVLNYRDDDYADRLHAATPDGVDRVVDVALEANLAGYAERLSIEAVVAAYATVRDPQVPMSQLMRRNAVLRFVLVYTVPQPALDLAVRDITAALHAGALAPLPERHFALDDIVAAHEAVEGGAVGKVLVDIP